MRLWQAAQTGSTILALALMLTSCGGNSSTTSASSLPSPNATPSPSPTPGNVPSPTPTPIPGNATVLNHVEESPWLTCGNCGNNGATGATAAYFDTLGITAPSQDGSSTQFSIAASVPYTNGYFYQKHTPVNAQINALTYEFDLYVPAGSESLPQGIEFECQQILNGWVYNFSWQALYPGNQWRIFDYGLKRWDATGISLSQFTPGTWHHIVADYHNDTVAHTVLHDALTVDGVRIPVNITHNAFFSGAVNNQFTNAVQLDSNSTAAPYSVYVDQMRISYQ
ncbi:MAG TPA: hypothetical protein VGP65_00350 [Candidatus Angelobacter sp.]|nr:hypothetical protein [Candidatus Angelobacter sp.]